MKTLIALLSILISFSAQAGVYKCVVNGITTYSQRPCGDGAEVVEVWYRPADPAAEAAITPADKSSSGAVDAYVERRKEQRRIRELEQKRRRLELDKAHSSSVPPPDLMLEPSDNREYTFEQHIDPSYKRYTEAKKRKPFVVEKRRVRNSTPKVRR